MSGARLADPSGRRDSGPRGERLTGDVPGAERRGRSIVTGPHVSWVRAFAQCRPACVFNELAGYVEMDVQDFGEIDSSSRCEFVRTPGIAGFSVKLLDPLSGLSRCVKFELEDQRKRIVVQRFGPGPTAESSMGGRPVLQLDSNRCLMEVEGQRPLELWQFIRLALEPLLFPE